MTRPYQPGMHQQHWQQGFPQQSELLPALQGAAPHPMLESLFDACVAYEAAQRPSAALLAEGFHTLAGCAKAAMLPAAHQRIGHMPAMALASY